MCDGRSLTGSDLVLSIACGKLSDVDCSPGQRQLPQGLELSAEGWPLGNLGAPSGRWKKPKSQALGGSWGQNRGGQQAEGLITVLHHRDWLDSQAEVC